MTPAQTFFAIVKESRKRQLAHDRASVLALESLLARTSEDLRHKLLTVPTGLRKERYRRDLLASLDETLDRFREQYKAQLDSGILEGASIAVQREFPVRHSKSPDTHPAWMDCGGLAPRRRRYDVSIS